MAEAYPEVPALKSRGRGQEGEAGDWKTWTYAQLHENVQVSFHKYLHCKKGLSI